MASRYVETAPEIDGVSGAGVGISHAHHHVHKGGSYVCGYTDLSVGSAEWFGIGFTTPAGDKKLHMVAQWASLGIAHAEIIEGVTLTDGTALTAYNRNRSSDSTSIVAASLKYYNSEEGTDDITGGTTIHETYAFSAKNVGTEGGRDILELVLKPSTTYGFKITSDALGGKAVLTLHFYEHTDVNA